MSERLNRFGPGPAEVVPDLVAQLGHKDFVVRAAAAKALASLPDPAILDSIRRFSAADTKDVQQIAASQLELLAAYHQVALAQSSRSFFWALIGSGSGLLLFAIAVAFSLVHGLELASVVPLIAGAIVQVVSGVVFYLYGKTSSQLSAFHSRLEVLQRYLLANSICESLDGEARNTARAALIQEISRAPSPTSTIRRTGRLLTPSMPVSSSTFPARPLAAVVPHAVDDVAYQHLAVRCASRRSSAPCRSDRT